MDATKKNLRTKIAEACDATGGIEKKGRNEMQKYSYLKAADVAKVFRHELFSRGVVILPHEKEYTELNRIKTSSGGEMIVWKLTVDYILLDADSDEKQVVQAFGVAMDSGDKAIYKCKTGAIKYFLRTMGLTPDEKDDPEADETVDQAVKPMPRPPIKKVNGEDSPSTTFSKHFWATAKKNGKTEAQVREWFGSLGYEHTAEVPPDKYAECYAWAETR